MEKLIANKVMLTKNENFGMFLGLIAVLSFSLTLPITRSLVGHLSVWDIGLGRSLLAALGALIYLAATRSKIPTKSQIFKLLITAIGITFGFPILTAVGMQTVPASHGGIVLGSLPITTALIGSALSGERPSKAYWIVAILGFAVIVAFVFISTGLKDISFYKGDIALISAVILASLGYAQGGALAKEMSGPSVISWTLVVSLPALIPAVYFYQTHQIFKI